MSADTRCEMCGKRYDEYKPGSPQRWCSRNCRARNHSLATAKIEEPRAHLGWPVGGRFAR